MSPSQPKNAEHPKEMISAYLDGQLEAPDRERVFEHLRDCAVCRDLLSDFRAIAAAARREEAPPLPADLAERIGRRIDAEPAVRLTRRWFPVARMRLPLATAAAVLVLSSLWVVWRGRLPGEPPAGAPPDAAPAPALVPDVPRAPSVSLAPAPSPKPAPPGEPGGLEPEVARNLDTLGYVGTREDAGSRERTGRRVEGGPSRSNEPVSAGPPPPAPLPMTDAPHLRKAASAGEGVAQAQPPHEEKKADTSFREAISPPGESRDLGAAATAGGEEGAAAGVRAPAAGAQALAPGVAGYAVAPVTAGPTLVFVMPEGRVSFLPDARIILASGDYQCTLRPGGPGEDEALADLRALASRRDPPAAGTEPSAAPPPGELVIPAPPGSGPLPPDLAAQMHRRVRALVRDRLLARAEAQCGPAPPALQGVR